MGETLAQMLFNNQDASHASLLDGRIFLSVCLFLMYKDFFFYLHVQKMHKHGWNRIDTF